MDDKNTPTPKLLVFTTLFPSSGQPSAGLFIRERMFRVGKILPVIVVAPVPWFPFQSLLRKWKPHFRPSAPRHEIQDGFQVYHPRFFSIPGLFKWLDGMFLAISSLRTVRLIQRKYKFDLIDAHFGYPDGYAATLLGKWLSVPVTITLRGTEVPHAKTILRRRLLRSALKRASFIFAVSGSLKRQAECLGIDSNKIRVVGNGVDTSKFFPEDKNLARQKLKISDKSELLITVGGLVERKGFHRVIEILPELKRKYPNIQYLIVGGASAEGDWGERLRELVQNRGLQECVHFLGTFPSDELRNILSAADVFVLSTRNEGWANVLLEAMACGLPVVVTDVGGNAEVVCQSEVGSVVPFGDQPKLTESVINALSKKWDKEEIIKYASENSWDKRVEVLVESFRKVLIEHTQLV